MAAIERTAYPTWQSCALHASDIPVFYTPTKNEIQWVENSLRHSPGSKNQKQLSSHYQQHCLNVLVLLKCFQRFHYFPQLRTVPKEIVTHIQQHLGFPDDLRAHYQHTQILYRHHTLIRDYLQVKPYTEGGKKIAEQIATASAKVHNYPSDIINQLLEELIKKRFELPAYSHIDRLVRTTRHQINQTIFDTVHQKLPNKLKNKFLSLTKSSPRTAFNRLKELPKSTTVNHFKELIQYHEWLMSFGSMKAYLADITEIKLKHFAGEAKSLDASDMRELNEAKRCALIASFIDHRQKNTKNDLVVMYNKTLAKVDKKSADKLKELREQNKEKTHDLLVLLRDIVTTAGKRFAPSKAKLLRKHIKNNGGHEVVLADCEAAIAYYTNNALPLAWQACRGSRSVLFSLLKTLDIYSNRKQDTLVPAKDFLLAHAHSKKEFLELTDNIDLSFMPQAWQKLVLHKENKKTYVVRRYFEVSMLMCISKAIESNDLHIRGSASYTDFSENLLSLEECEKLIPDYCNAIGLAQTGKAARQALCQALTDKAATIDKRYPKIKELVIDENGVPTLKKRPKDKKIASSKLQEIIEARMPKRKLLDILVSMQNSFGWASVFGPMSGSEPKIADAIEHYILTTFAYGTGMGPKQTSDHLQKNISAHMLSWVNRRHVTAVMQHKAMIKLINPYMRYDLTKRWGLGKSAIADGTLRKIRRENLTAEKHIRYGAVGGIAYHHIADNYIALFTSFIPCGVWEAVEILEALLKNASELQPDTVHGDTQAQSTVVFAIAYLLGIKLMPRIRNWKNLKFYRPQKSTRYKNINSLFKDTVNWKLIEDYWQEMLQLVLSIKEGKLTSSLLLRKFGSYNKNNKLCLALRELGYVIRTLFLLDYVSNVELREGITVETNKVESFNSFTEWVTFGNPYTIVASNDPEEHEKSVKYTDIIANVIMLQNVIDMSDTILMLHDEGYTVTDQELSHLSPYIRSNINRFGQYVVNMDIAPINIHRAMKLPI